MYVRPANVALFRVAHVGNRTVDPRLLLTKWLTSAGEWAVPVYQGGRAGKMIVSYHVFKENLKDTKIDAPEGRQWLDLKKIVICCVFFRKNVRKIAPIFHVSFKRRVRPN